MRFLKPLFSRSHGDDTRAVRTPRAGRFCAVEIGCGNAACGAAKRVSRKRFLAIEAPRLPLASCDRPERCACSYRHLDDRRQGPRRLPEIGGTAQLGATGVTKRKWSGRRAEDRSELSGDAVADILEDTYYDYVSRHSD